ncbi:membrane bound transporter [Aspergillus pseudotamarii]|uniref:Membrane bound transporter n=1 Tax=Aspergillus pseudotamarii TaxID=132259 RepID=A0A5N6T6B4_ASPPS|nr:membrane bound transporter [Aspergillus pseudotamarii]KAE8141873.1 membrane bound transporter [Aspergillus pseudotamarii]
MQATQLVAFWKYWMYWLNPVTYLVGSILTFTIFDVNIVCSGEELAVFDPPANMTCSDYLAAFLRETGANLVNPDDSADCRACQYTKGSDYLRTINLNDWYYGWRAAAIIVLFVLSSFSLLYVFMNLKTKTSKRAE